MAMHSIEEAIADIQTGLARTLAAICNQLIDRKALSRELLIADLAAVYEVLAESGVGELGQAVPQALATALQQNASLQP